MEKLLIALDIDGTIAEHTGAIQQETKEVLNQIAQQGHHIILATGRSDLDMTDIIDEVGQSSEWFIASNGAYIFQNLNPGTDTPNYQQHQVLTVDPNPHLTHFHKLNPDTNFILEVHKDGFYYNNNFHMPFTGNIPRYQTATENLYGRNSLRFIITDTIDKVDQWHKELQQYGYGTVAGYDHNGDHMWIEISHPDANKATALETIRKELNIHPRNLLAFGDGHNDISMLQWAGKEGTSYAMGHAHQDVKDAATHVTGTLQELGVATILKTLL